MENVMDKFVLLTYTCTGYDGFPHFCHAWFRTEEELRLFVCGEVKTKKDFEVDLSIEILDYRRIDLQLS